MTIARWFAVTAACTAAAARVLAQGADVDRWYNDSLLRSDGLMIGCAFALAMHTGGLPEWVSSRGLVVGAGGVFAGSLWLAHIEVTVWSADRTLVAVATIAVIGLVIDGRHFRMAKVLTHPVMLWLGVRSYAIYLWHFAMLRNGLVRGDVVWAIALTLIAADLSYRFVEQPCNRFKNRERQSRSVPSLVR